MKSSGLRSQLSQALVKLYRSILVYLGKAGKYYKQNTAGGCH